MTWRQYFKYRQLAFRIWLTGEKQMLANYLAIVRALSASVNDRARLDKFFQQVDEILNLPVAELRIGTPKDKPA